MYVSVPGQLGEPSMFLLSLCLQNAGCQRGRFCANNQGWTAAINSSFQCCSQSQRKRHLRMENRRKKEKHEEGTWLRKHQKSEILLAVHVTGTGYNEMRDYAAANVTIILFKKWVRSNWPMAWMSHVIKSSPHSPVKCNVQYNLIAHAFAVQITVA